jgi:hypothetical protein
MAHTLVIHHYGLFMVAWSVLESVVQAGIMKELKLKPVQAQILTSSMMFRQRVAVLSSLLRLRREPPSQAILLLSKLETGARRNALVHGHIIVGIPGQLTFVKSSVSDETGFKARKFVFTAAELLKHIQEVNEKTSRLQALLSITDQETQQLADTALGAAA